MNLQDRDNLGTKDKKPVPKVSFVLRFNCRGVPLQFGLKLCSVDECIIAARPHEFQGMRN